MFVFILIIKYTYNSNKQKHNNKCTYPSLHKHTTKNKTNTYPVIKIGSHDHAANCHHNENLSHPCQEANGEPTTAEKQSEMLLAVARHAGEAAASHRRPDAPATAARPGVAAPATARTGRNANGEAETTSRSESRTRRTS
jgi:hypothetical protein